MNKIILNVQLVPRKLNRVEVVKTYSVVARYALEEKTKYQQQQETKGEKKKMEAYLFSKSTH